MNLLAQAAPNYNFWAAEPGSARLWIMILVSLLVGAGFYAALFYAPSRIRKPIVWTFTFAGGLFYVLYWAWPQPVSYHPDDIPNGFVENVGFWLHDALPRVADISNILTAFLLGLGIYSLLRIHTGRIVKRQADRGFSVVFFIAMLAILVFGYWDWSLREADTKGLLQDSANWQLANFGQNLLFDGFLQQMDSAMFSMIAFFILSAAYRAFRIRSVESTVLMASALILMVSLLTLVVTNWDSGVANLAKNVFHDSKADPATFQAGYLNWMKLSSIANWLKAYMQVPALRAVDWGIGLGALAMGLRLWLGLEKGGVSV